MSSPTNLEKEERKEKIKSMISAAKLSNGGLGFLGDRSDEVISFDHLFNQKDLSSLGMKAIRLNGGKICVVDFSKVVGKGGNAIVFEGYDEEGHPLAMRFERSMDQTLSKRARRELKQLKDNERSILKMLGMFRGEAKFNGMVCQAQPLLEGGELKDLLENADLSDVEKWSLVLKIAYQVKWMHEFMKGKNILHNDLKPGNIIVNPNLHKGKIVSQIVSLIDFGYSMIANSGEPIKSDLRLASPPYAPPQIVDFEKNADGSLKLNSQGGPTVIKTDKKAEYSVQSDCYALGKIMEDMEIESDFVKKLISRDPNKRPSVDDIILEATKNLKQQKDVEPYIIDLIKISERDRQPQKKHKKTNTWFSDNFKALKEKVSEVPEFKAIMNSTWLTTNEKMIVLKGAILSSKKPIQNKKDWLERIHLLSGTSRFVNNGDCIKQYLAFKYFCALRHNGNDRYSIAQNQKFKTALFSASVWMSDYSLKGASKFTKPEKWSPEKKSFWRDHLMKFLDCKTPEAKENWAFQLKQNFQKDLLARVSRPKG